MRLACRLINGDGIGFEYATVELTPDYVAYLLRLVDEAERLRGLHDAFCEIEFMDYEAQYGASLGGLEKNLPEFGEGRKWIKIPDDYEWPEDSPQSVAASTVAITKGTIVWRALGSHDVDGPYYETDELPVEKLRCLFPQQEEQKSEEQAAEDTTACDCELPGYFCSGVPGILAHVENGQYVAGAEGAKVERCDSCERYPSDKVAFDKLVELGIASGEPPSLSPTLPHANQYEKEYIDAGGGFCPNCRSDQTEGDSVDFDGRHCTQRMWCLDCHAVWFDVYTLSSVSSVEPRGN